MNYVKELTKVMGIINYKGCLIAKNANKQTALGKSFSSVQEAKNYIDQSFNNFKITYQ